MKDKQNMEGLWKSSRRSLLIVAFGILLYECLENFTVVSTAVGGFFNMLKPVVIGAAIAYIANMPMGFLERRVFAKWKPCKLKRVVSLVLAMLLVLCVVAAFVWVIVPNFVESIGTLAQNFDSYAKSVTEWASDLWERLNLRPEVEESLAKQGRELIDRMDELLGSVVSWALKFTVGMAGVLVSLVFALIMCVYVLGSKETLSRQAGKLVRAVFSQDSADAVLDVAQRTNNAVHQYVFGMLTECFILGSLCFIGLSIFKFPYALLFSVVIGMSQLIPIVGPWAGGLVCTVIMFVVDPTRALWFALFVLILEQVESNIIYPQVVGNAVGISGMWVLLAVLIGGGLFGVVGVLLCVPVMAVLYTLMRDWVNNKLKERRIHRQFEEQDL